MTMYVVMSRPSAANELRISEAEWRVMEVLWELETARPAEIIEALEIEADWNHRTIRTLLSRLNKKGAVKAVESGARYRYAPAVSRDECLRVERRSFVRRFFSGDVRALVTHFVQSDSLSSKDLKELRTLLDAAEKSVKKKPTKRSK